MFRVLVLFWEAQDFKRFGFRVLGFRVVHRIMQDSSTPVAFDTPGLVGLLQL